MKEIGLYWHESMGVAYQFEEDFKRQGIPVNNYESCLCELVKNTEIKEKVVLFHPGDHKDCWERSRSVIIANPSSQFYIFALGRPGRIEGIGRHENTHYLGDMTSIGKFRRNIREILGE